MFNINNLEKNLSNITYKPKDFNNLIKFLKKENPNGKWWISRFIEEDFDYISLSEITFQDLISDFKTNDFLDLLDSDLSHIIYWGDSEKEREEIITDYLKIIEETKYDEFLSEVFYPVLKTIQKGLDKFHFKNFIHIQHQQLNKRFFEYSGDNSFLIKTYQSKNIDDFYRFSRESLKVFNVDGYIELQSVQNKAVILNLIEGLAAIDVNSKKNYFFINYEESYKELRRKNIADLGRGFEELVMLIIRVYTVFDRLNRENKRKEMVGSKSKDTKKLEKLLLIEEPEAFLHPNWQSKLADFFVFLLKRSNKTNIRLIIETHSVYLIQRIQYLVAKKELRADDVFVYYFNNNSEKEKFYDMGLRNDGLFKEKFGTGFYDQTSKLTLEILNAQNNG